MVTGRAESRSNPSSASREWRFQFPNSADFNFNYWKLLNDARRARTAIAKPPTHVRQLRIAIIGAGVAGLTAARELFRSGYANIDIYEATGRIGGRTYSEPSPLPGDTTIFEMGAMRLPFFWPYRKEGALKPPKTRRKGQRSQNALTDYYCQEFKIRTQPFPNPGSGTFKTGIYINRGYGPSPRSANVPSLLLWKRPGGKTGNVDLDEIRKRWLTFKKRFQNACRRSYSDKVKWPQIWRDIVNEYRDLNFREFVLMPEGTDEPGKFGGLGLNDGQARIFAVVGMGDGGWGAFYDISCLYVLRTFMFGFADDLQMIIGQVKEDGSPSEAFGEIPLDSLEHEMTPPKFLGVQALAECLLYKPSTSYRGNEKSLYDATKEARNSLCGVHLFLRTPVRKVRRLPTQRLLVASNRWPDGKQYDHVIVTAMPWSFEVEAGFENFPTDGVLPWRVRDAMKSSHFITSCKVFFPLKQRFWEKSKIPQVIVTDTFLQGAYGIAVSRKGRQSDKGYRGVLLASYTWEDDATKLLGDSDDELANRCLAELDEILFTRCRNIQEKISPYVVKTPKVWHWERTPSYRGCARLYRQGSWDSDYALLTYNREYSAASHLYLAGEAYSVEGGWVEPALRSALDAVIHLVNHRCPSHTKGEFSNRFKFNLYPHHIQVTRPASE